MISILNKTPRPLRLRLPGGKTLHLGPNKTAKVSDQAAELPSFRKQIEAGVIMILGEEGQDQESLLDSARDRVHGSTHGHPQQNVVQVKGNR